MQTVDVPSSVPEPVEGVEGPLSTALSESTKPAAFSSPQFRLRGSDPDGIVLPGAGMPA